MSMDADWVGDGPPDSCADPLWGSHGLLFDVYRVILMKVSRLRGRSQWPRGPRRGSAAANFLGLWVRIPPAAGMSVVSVVCCEVEVSVSGCSLVRRNPTDCGSSLCVI